jgi:hypothetical protein
VIPNTRNVPPPRRANSRKTSPLAFPGSQLKLVAATPRSQTSPQLRNPLPTWRERLPHRSTPASRYNSSALGQTRSLNNEAATSNWSRRELSLIRQLARQRSMPPIAVLDASPNELQLQSTRLADQHTAVPVTASAPRDIDTAPTKTLLHGRRPASSPSLAALGRRAVIVRF